MSDANDARSHLPADDAEIAALAYVLAIHFHPAIKLERKKGLVFAGNLSSAIDARGVELGDEKWSFSQPLGPNAASRFQVTVTGSQLVMDLQYPGDRQELFETKCKVILTEFEKMFRPELLLSSSAVIRATLQIDGDARTFLMTHVTQFESTRLTSLKRPVHLFGIRLFMPPYKKSKAAPSKGKKPKKAVKNDVETVPWMVDIKAESLIEDTSKLFLEAQAEWHVPRKWSSGVSAEAVDGLRVTSDYLKQNFIPFLRDKSV